MKKFRFLVMDERQTCCYITDFAVCALAYEIARTFMNRTHEEAVRCASLTWDMYGERGVPVVDLADYVAKHFKRLEPMKKWDRLNDFYNNFESENYEIPEHIMCNQCGYKQDDKATVFSYWELKKEEEYLCGACMDTSTEEME